MDGIRKLSELTTNELIEIANQKFIPYIAAEVNPNALVLLIDGNINQTLSSMSEVFKIYIKEKFGINLKNNSFRTNFKKIQEPKIGETYFRISEDGKSLIPCKIIFGSLFRNGRLSNFWDWENLLTGEKESGYGKFFAINKR